MRQINAEAVIEAVKADLEAEDRIDLLEWLVGWEETNHIALSSFVADRIKQIGTKSMSTQDDSLLSLQGFLNQTPTEKGRGVARKTLTKAARYEGLNVRTEAEFIEKAQRQGGHMSVSFRLRRPLTRTQFNRMDNAEQRDWEAKQVEGGFIPTIYLSLGPDTLGFQLSSTGLKYALYRRISVAEIGYDNNYLDFDRAKKLKARIEQDYPHIFAAARL